jgi:hypothetical protein
LQGVTVLERLGADEPLSMTSYGHTHSRSFGRPGLVRASDSVPRGHSPTQVAALSAKPVSLVKDSNVSKVNGESNGASSLLKRSRNAYVCVCCLHQLGWTFENTAGPC